MTVPRNTHVSICLSTYNEGEFVARTVKAILERTDYPSFDVIVHDHGSTDGCCDCLPSDPRLSVLTSDRRHGVAGGKKIAVEAGSGPLLLSMDCHVAPSDPSWLDQLVAVMAELEFAAVLSPIIKPLDPETWKVKPASSYLTELKDDFRVRWGRRVARTKPHYEVSALRGVAKLMTRETYHRIGGFDEALAYGGEEADVSLRSWMAGFRNAYVSTSVIGHVFKRKSQFTRSRADEVEARLRVAYKCLTDATFATVVDSNRVLARSADKWQRRAIEEGISRIHKNRDELDLLRQDVRRRSVVSGEWVLDRFAIGASNGFTG